MLTILLTGILSLFLSSPALSEEREFSISQGVISSVEGMPESIVVNERKIRLSDDVKVKDSGGYDVRLSELKQGKWVYIVSDGYPEGFKAKRIYIIPRYIGKGEKDKYPFMKKEEEQR